MKTFLLLFTLLHICFQTIAAQNSHSLSDVLALTVLNNPELDAFNYDLRAADAGLLQAGILPNPELSVELENIDSPRYIQTTFLLSQLIELGGKRKAREQLAKCERSKIALDYEVRKRELFVDTTSLFIDVLLNQQKLEFLEENLQVLQNFSSIVEKRIQAGKASTIEESNFIVLLNTARIDLKSAQNQLRIAKNKLAAQWGETDDDAFAVTGKLDWSPQIVSLEQMSPFIQEHPEMVRSYFESDVRAARLGLEKSESYPDLIVNGGPRYLKEANKWTGIVGVSIPLPLNDRNQGGVWGARENADKIERERQTLWISLLTELKSTYWTAQTIFSELELLKNFIIPAAQKAYDCSYKGYELSRYNYLEHLESERAYRTSKIRYLETLAEYHKALAIIQGLTGSKTICGGDDDI